MFLSSFGAKPLLAAGCRHVLDQGSKCQELHVETKLKPSPQAEGRCEQHEVLLALMSHPHLLQAGREMWATEKERWEQERMVVAAVKEGRLLATLHPRFHIQN